MHALFPYSSAALDQQLYKRDSRDNTGATPELLTKKRLHTGIPTTTQRQSRGEGQPRPRRARRRLPPVTVSVQLIPMPREHLAGVYSTLLTCSASFLNAATSLRSCSRSSGVWPIPAWAAELSCNLLTAIMPITARRTDVSNILYIKPLTGLLGIEAGLDIRQQVDRCASCLSLVLDTLRALGGAEPGVVLQVGRGGAVGWVDGEACHDEAASGFRHAGPVLGGGELVVAVADRLHLLVLRFAVEWSVAAKEEVADVSGCQGRRGGLRKER